jgi:hypothetical protein
MYSTLRYEIKVMPCGGEVEAELSAVRGWKQMARPILDFGALQHAAASAPTPA